MVAPVSCAIRWNDKLEWLKPLTNYHFWYSSFGVTKTKSLWQIEQLSN